MMMEKSRPRGLLATTFGGIWRVVDGARRLFLNLLFLLLLAAVAAVWWTSRAPALKARTVLVLDLNGAIVEQRSGGARERALQQVRAAAGNQVQLRDVLQALDRAANDADITSVLLMTDELSGGGLPTQREIAAAITRFRASGKKVVAWGMQYDQRAYYLAAHADEVYLHPMGAVLIEGYGRRRNYYRDALERLGISANVVRVGKFKNAAEPFFANAPSPETVEADTELYKGLWALYVDGVEKARRLPSGHITRMIDGLPDNLAAVDGDPARLALDLKLVDGLMTPDALRALLVDRGVRDDKTKSFRQIGLAEYLQRPGGQREGDAVGVVVAEGEIIDGKAPAGRVGGQSTAELLRRAREDETIKAVVLRVDSPGGSAVGSELIRRELQLTRAAGKPVVVSMGDVAASGGYWISLAADEVLADPATITGSIGVFGMLPTAPGLMDKLSLHSAGTATTWLADGYDPRKPLDPRMLKLVQSVIDHIYVDFSAKAAAARKLAKDKVEAVAQGRVWSGQQARERGLVDKLGGFSEALAAARTRAKLPADARVSYLAPEGGRLARLLGWLDDSARHELAALVRRSLSVAGFELPAAAAPVIDEVQRDLEGLSALMQGRGAFQAVVHCLCMPAE